MRDRSTLAQPTLPVAFLTGPVGVGKTTVGSEMSVILRAQGVPHAFVDLDALTWSYPSPPDDPYRIGLMLRNLTSVWREFARSGARRLILARVLERPEELERYRVALPNAEFRVVLLQAAPETLLTRLRDRERGLAYDHHARRAETLSAAFMNATWPSLIVQTESESPDVIARKTLVALGWMPPS